MAPVFLAFDYLRRRHPETHIHTELKGYDAAAKKGILYGMNHPRGGDSYVMAAVLYVTLTGRKIGKSPDLDQVNAALKKSHHPDSTYAMTAETQAIVHQVAYEACEDFAKRVNAMKEKLAGNGSTLTNSHSEGLHTNEAQQ